MFKDTNRGFHMTFENGWTVSVQWNRGTYVEGRNMIDDDYSPTAEIAAWDEIGNWHRFDHDVVQGYQTTNNVAEFIAMIAAK